MPIRYDLDKLGWFDFEELVQSLLKLRLGIGVEAWGGSGDWGCDAYFDGELAFPAKRRRRGLFVFQAKFVDAANAAGAKPAQPLLAAVDKEVARIQARRAKKVGPWSKRKIHYTLVTNAPVSTKTRTQLMGRLKPLKLSVSILANRDLAALLNLSPDIVQAFPQLLGLHDLLGVLRRAVRAEVVARSEIALRRGAALAPVFVPTSAYYGALEKLYRHNFVLLEGPPEMGKTAIGSTIAATQAARGWEAIECRLPKDILGFYEAAKSQVFVADDFFGRGEFTPSRVSVWQEELSNILEILDSRHWLVLTSRLHILNLAKRILDVGRFNGVFPEVGELVVNAGALTPLEKGRILYRHAKAANLTAGKRTLLRGQASALVANAHYTPERVRILMARIVECAEPLEEGSFGALVALTLTNPTQQMKVSFRALPPAHRWLMFALAEQESSGSFSGDPSGRYEALCPATEHVPYSTVVAEMANAFVVTVPNSLFGRDGVDWVHPSCRDLAIGELAADSASRAHFLSHCSAAGLALATSVLAGSTGTIAFPLLTDKADWELLLRRADELQRQSDDVVRLLLDSREAAAKAGVDSSRLRRLDDTIGAVARVALETYSSEHWDAVRRFMGILEARALTGEAFPEEVALGLWSQLAEGGLADLESNRVPWQRNRKVDDALSLAAAFASHAPELAGKLRAASDALVMSLIAHGADASGVGPSSDDTAESVRDTRDGLEGLAHTYERAAEVFTDDEEWASRLKEMSQEILAESQNWDPSEFRDEPEDSGRDRAAWLSRSSVVRRTVEISRLFEDL